MQALSLVALRKSWTLHDSIEIVSAHTHHIELRDSRTEFHLSLESETALYGERGVPSRAFFDTLNKLGFLDSIPLPLLRVRQRPFRIEMRNALRNEALTDFFSFARSHVPFYQTPGYDIAGMDEVGDLKKLPILRKADIRENFDRLLSKSVNITKGLASGTLRIARTSGTTDERIQVISDLTIDQVPPDYEKVWNIDLAGRTPRTAILTTPICSATECHLGKAPMHERIHHEIVLYLNSTEDLFSAPEALTRNIIEELLEFRPDFLLVNPYYLMWFGREAIRLGLALPKIELILTSYQYASQIHKRALAAMFGAPVYNSYSATELAGCMLGVECKNGRWHAYENHSIIEILGDETIGPVAATVFAGRLMPLIRYEVGDLARMDDADCDCPLSDWQCFEFHGRQKDTLIFSGRSFTTKQVDDMMARVAGIDFYRCVQDSESSVVLDIIPSPGMPMPRQEIEECLRSGLPVERIGIHQVARLDPEPSMKFRLTAHNSPS